MRRARARALRRSERGAVRRVRVARPDGRRDDVRTVPYTRPGLPGDGFHRPSPLAVRVLRSHVAPRVGSRRARRGRRRRRARERRRGARRGGRRRARAARASRRALRHVRAAARGRQAHAPDRGRHDVRVERVHGAHVVRAVCAAGRPRAPQRPLGRAASGAVDAAPALPHAEHLPRADAGVATTMPKLGTFETLPCLFCGHKRGFTVFCFSALDLENGCVVCNSRQKQTVVSFHPSCAVRAGMQRLTHPTKGCGMRCVYRFDELMGMCGLSRKQRIASECLRRMGGINLHLFAERPLRRYKPYFAPGNNLRDALGPRRSPPPPHMQPGSRFLKVMDAMVRGRCAGRCARRCARECARECARRCARRRVAWRRRSARTRAKRRSEGPCDRDGGRERGSLGIFFPLGDKDTQTLHEREPSQRRARASRSSHTRFGRLSPKWTKSRSNSSTRA